MSTVKDGGDEYVEPEVAALLAATEAKSDSLRRGNDPGSLLQQERRRRHILAARAPRSKGLLHSLLAAITVAVVLFFTYLSMSSLPFNLATEVEGSWSAEGQGPVARTQLVETSRDIEIVARSVSAATPTSTSANVVEGAVPLDVLPSKLQSHNYSSYINCAIGRYTVDGMVQALPVQTNTLSFTWETICRKSETALAEVSATAQGDGAPTNEGTTIEEVMTTKDVACSFLLNKRRLVATFFDGGAPVVFLLQRTAESTRGGFAQFWDTKGKYLFCMLFLVVFLKGMQTIVDPPRLRHSPGLIGRRGMAGRRFGHAPSSS